MLSLLPSSLSSVVPERGNAKVSRTHSSPFLILNMFDVWVIGLATVICGQMTGWNAGVSVGSGAYATMQFIMMIAYVILACSLGEMIGTTLFSGGSYGIARVTLGFYGGFMIGALELLEHIVFTATALEFMGNHMCQQLDIDNTVYFPIVCFLYCLLQYGIIQAGHNAYWCKHT